MVILALLKEDWLRLFINEAYLGASEGGEAIGFAPALVRMKKSPGAGAGSLPGLRSAGGHGPGVLPCRRLNAFTRA